MRTAAGCARRAQASAAEIAAVFNRTFGDTEQTVLIGGADEPLYCPATDGSPARILHRHDYASSALHEIAHWCIAGRERRQLTDYGYWYAPDGRSAAQQRAFIEVEARPQALEWMFSRPCAVPFRISVDNLDAPRDLEAERGLRQAVVQEARRLASGGMSPRAARFLEALCSAFNPALQHAPTDFCETALR